ncbi:hypothetical protein BN2497_12837 [Janthinobacterium sp. CG23_2]|nr:hypothetical protein BN2497_12837 [Janthinobacterium sp. CG23_2]CUU32816.1 hypothetical protein BN3177_12837 [Janthinobacterium sp. CG23_2]
MKMRTAIGPERCIPATRIDEIVLPGPVAAPARYAGAGTRLN